MQLSVLVKGGRLQIAAGVEATEFIEPIVFRADAPEDEAEKDLRHEVGDVEEQKSSLESLLLGKLFPATSEALATEFVLALTDEYDQYYSLPEECKHVESERCGV